MEQFLSDLMPWLGLLCAFGIGLLVPAAAFRLYEIRKEKQARTERLSWSPKIIPLHQPLDRDFLESREHWKHMNVPVRKVRR